LKHARCGDVDSVQVEQHNDLAEACGGLKLLKRVFFRPCSERILHPWVQYLARFGCIAGKRHEMVPQRRWGNLVRPRRGKVGRFEKVKPIQRKRLFEKKIAERSQPARTGLPFYFLSKVEETALCLEIGGEPAGAGRAAYADGLQLPVDSIGGNMSPRSAAWVSFIISTAFSVEMAAAFKKLSCHAAQGRAEGDALGDVESVFDAAAGEDKRHFGDGFLHIQN
jgi:hypothetical protein